MGDGGWRDDGYLVELVVTVEGDIKPPARAAGRGVGQPDDQPEDWAQPQHLGDVDDGGSGASR